jgi:hypothetical protein
MKKNGEITIRSSAAEYLTFVAATGGSADSVEMRYQDENIWLTQKLTAALYDVSVAAINQHIKRIYSDGELTPEATIKKYLIVQTEGSRRVEREIDHYNLQFETYKRKIFSQVLDNAPKGRIMNIVRYLLYYNCDRYTRMRKHIT